MRVLLDTNVLIWWLIDDRRLSATHRAIIEDADNEVFVSAVSAVEVAIKAAIGKLPDLPEPLTEAVPGEGFRELRFSLAHAGAVRTLPLHHADPFDRMLIAQALVEDLTVLTSDAAFAAYGVALA
ncbi:MAG: type II toxin-antitoxin system VapC family toxin [Bifidobacteriaceae bacterium]|jgi:PIN domain nuclease of toxin-antitoxin system|nr:type II toxin-antitoxin system VapC family toxin [Bifidobacteriaceae bacterium]